MGRANSRVRNEISGGGGEGKDLKPVAHAREKKLNTWVQGGLPKSILYGARTGSGCEGG